MSKKAYNTQMNVGKAKYVVNFHDGVKTHNDGSAFFDIQIFKNKTAFDAFTLALSRTGYAKSNT